MIRKCPHCGYQTEEASLVGRVPTVKTLPEDGDCSLCLACGEVSIFALDFVGLRLRLPTEEEHAALAQSSVVQEVRQAWRTTRDRYRAAWPGQP